MSRPDTILVFLVLCMVGCAGMRSGERVDFMPEMKGFRGYAWGTSIDDITDALFVQGFDDKRNIEWFSRQDDPLRMGKADLESIDYVFRDDKFVAVSIIAKGASNFAALRSELEARLGEAQFQDGDAFSWNLPHSLVLFNFKAQSETSMLVIRTKG